MFLALKQENFDLAHERKLQIPVYVIDKLTTWPGTYQNHLQFSPKMGIN